MAVKGDGVITVPGLRMRAFKVEITGLMPLIAHQLSQRAVEEIEARQQAVVKARAPRPTRDPVQEFNDARYRLPDGTDVFPSLALKMAMKNEAKHLRITKTRVSEAVHFTSQYVKIEPGEPVMRTDRVNLGTITKVMGLAYRPEYQNWKMILPMRVDTELLTEADVVNLLNRAGTHFGIGDWRVEKGGTHGMFEVTGTDFGA